MANCINIINIDSTPELSPLFTELKHYFKDTEGTISRAFYNNVIRTESPSDNSFFNWINKHDSPLFYENGEPTIDMIVDWLKFINKTARYEKTFITNNLQTTVTEFHELSQGLTAFIGETIAEKGLSYNDLFEGAASIKNIRNIALKKLSERLKANVTALNTQPDFRDLQKRLALIEREISADENKYIFFEAFNNYLDATLGFKINNEFDEDSDVLSDIIEENEAKETRDSAFTKNANEFDVKTSAPNSIKLSIASLTQKEMKNGKLVDKRSSIGLPKLVDYNITFNYIQQKLVDLPADIDIFTRELKTHTDLKPEFLQFLNILNFGNIEYSPSEDMKERMKEMRFRTQFVNQFDKTKYNQTLHIKKDDGTVAVIDSNLDKMQNVRFAEWENNFKVLRQEYPKSYNEDNFEVIKGASDERLLKFLGIDSDNILNNAAGREHLDEIRKNGLKDFQSFFTIYDSKSKSQGDVRARILQLAKIDAESNGEIIELQHYNAEGKLVYDISLNTYLSKVVKDLSYYAGDIAKLEELYPELFLSNYASSSRWRALIESGRSIEIGISNGFKNDTKKKSLKTADLSRKDITIQKVHSLLMEGEYNFVNAADRSVENVIRFKDFRGPQGLIADKKSSAVTWELTSHLLAEAKLIDSLSEKTGVLNLDTEQALKTRIFQLRDGSSIYDIYPAEKIASMTWQDIREDDKIHAFLTEKMDEVIAEELEYFAEHQVTNFDVEAPIKQYGSFENVVELYAINAFLGNIEISKIFVGDPQLYGTPANFFKRMSMMNSTKESARSDAEMNNFISDLENNNEILNDYVEGRQGSTIKTITFNDIAGPESLLTQQERDSLREILGREGAYNVKEEADGFAYITYDEYRIMKLRYGEWQNADEKLYQKLTTEEDPKITEEEYGLIVPDKSQYTGKLMNAKGEEYNVVAGRKFSFLPLVPGLYSPGSVLETLHRKMSEQGIGMAFMQSAAKFGHVSPDGKSAYHDFYSDGNTNDLNATEDTIDLLDYKYLGNQLRISKKAKTENTEGTQKRKLNLSNFYEKGKLAEGIDENTEDILDVYDALQKERIRRSYAKLKGRLGLSDSFSADNPTDMKKFVEAFTEMGILQGFTTNELKALQELLEIPVLDILPNKQQVQSFISAKLKKKVIRQKRHGTALAQASNVGFEIPGVGNRNDLKFYRKAKTTIKGEILLPMEVLMPLPKELMAYVSYKYGDNDGAVNQKMLDKFNEDIAKDNEKYERTGMQSELTKITTMVGFRIPTQGASSSDVLKVKRYYMPHISGTVVVPKGIVVKTGSDFDIDKLNIYIPEFRTTGDPGFKNAKFFVKQFSRAQVTKYLKYLDIDANYNQLTMSELNQLFIDNVLDVSIDQLENPLLQVYNAEYKKGLSKGVQQLEYISAEGKYPSEMTDKELTNATLENEIELSLAKANWKQMLTPLDSTNLNGIVDLLRSLTGYVAENSMADIFTAKKNTDKRVEFLSGKAGVGQTAVHNPNHILAQKAGLQMKAVHHYFGLENSNGFLDVGITVNEDGILISELLSELLTAYVDIAKDPKILDINAVNATANTIMMMLRQGIGLKKIFLFMNQPIIKDYLKEQSEAESMANDRFVKKDDVITRALRKYNIGTNVTNMVYNVEARIASEELTFRDRLTKDDIGYEDFSEAELEAEVKNGGRNKKLQQQALDIFLTLQDQSKIFQKMIRSTSPDTQQFKSFTVMEDQLALKKEISESGWFLNYDKMFDTFIGTFWEAKNDYKENISKVMLSQKVNYKPELDGLKHFVMDNVQGDAKEAHSFKIENDLVIYLLNKLNVINHSKDFEELFVGPKSVPKMVMKLKAHFKQFNVDNKFLENVVPLINDNYQGFDNLKPINKKLTSIEKEEMYSAMSDLEALNENISAHLKLPEGRDFYRDLRIFALMQSGINNSPFNITTTIPVSDYVDIIKNTIKTARDAYVDISGYTRVSDSEVGAYILNNPGIIANKTSLPVHSKYKAAEKAYKIYPKHGQAVWQKGSGVRALNLSTIQVAAREPENDNPATFTEDNKLNNQCNK